MYVQNMHVASLFDVCHGSEDASATRLGDTEVAATKTLARCEI
jgi:hypothetical protein